MKKKYIKIKHRYSQMQFKAMASRLEAEMLNVVPGEGALVVPLSLLRVKLPSLTAPCETNA